MNVDTLLDWWLSLTLTEKEYWTNRIKGLVSMEDLDLIDLADIHSAYQKSMKSRPR